MEHCVRIVSVKIPVPLENCWLCLGQEMVRLIDELFFFKKSKSWMSTSAALSCDGRWLSGLCYLLELFKERKNKQTKKPFKAFLWKLIG